MNTANLRRLLDEATARPWVHEDGSYWIRDPAQPKYVGLVECHDSAMNAALIVELVNNADELLAENERLRLERQELIDSVAAIRQQQKEKEWPVTGGLVTALEQKP